MILAIDTSSARAAVAVIDGGRVVAESIHPAGRGFDVAAEVGRLVPDLARLEAVLVALGPGSFTGLRQGIAFGVGLAMSLRIPLLGIGTLELTAARSPSPAVALSEAGRGRVFFLTPDGQRGIAAAAEVPTGWPAVGWLKSEGVAGLLSDSDQASFGTAVLAVAGKAKEVGYATVRPEYMHDFGRLD